MPLVCQAPLVPLVPLAPLVDLAPPEGLLDPLALLDLAGREFLAVGLPPGWFKHSSERLFLCRRLLHHLIIVPGVELTQHEVSSLPS